VTNESHPDLDVLSDWQEDLLPSEAAAETAAHVASCGECAAAVRSLEAVTATLAGDRAPRMPDAVAERLDRAVRQAAAERSAPGRSAAAAPVRRDATPTPTPARPAHRRPRWLPAAAAAAVAVVAGMVGVSLLQGESEPNAADSGVSESAGSAGGSSSERPEAGDSVGALEARPDDVVRLAVGLAAGRRTPTAPEPACQTPGDAKPDDVVSLVTWRGRSAVLVVSQQPHVAQVYDCDTGTRRLFRTAY
jgi:hypothetical protein